MTFAKLVRSARSWYHRRDLRETLHARWLDTMALARSLKRRLRVMR